MSYAGDFGNRAVSVGLQSKWGFGAQLGMGVGGREVGLGAQAGAGWTSKVAMWRALRS